MSQIDETQLKQNIKENDFSNCYLFYGDETYLKEFYLSSIKKKLIQPDFEAFNLHEYEGSSVSIDEIIIDADSFPMIGEYNLVVISDYPFDKRKDDLKKLEEYLNDVPSQSVIVFWYKFINFDIKNATWKKLNTLISNHGDSVEFKQKSESDLVKFICSKSKKMGKTITNNDARYLVSYVGSDLETISNEISKLCNFAKSDVLDKKTIDSVCIKCLQAKIYDITKNICKSKYDDAFSTMNELLDNKEEPITILSVITNSFVDMYRVKCAKSTGINEMDLKNYFAYTRDFVLTNASRDGASYSIEQLRDSLDVLMAADNVLKSSSVDKKIVLEEVLAKLLLISKGIAYAKD